MFYLQKDFLLSGVEAEPSDRPNIYKFLHNLRYCEEEVLRIAKRNAYVF